MSNYLDRLVTRSLNPMATSVQPRLPSLFEPATGVLPLGIVPVDSGEPEGTSAFAATQPRQMTSPEIPTRIEDTQPTVRRSPPPLDSESSPLEPRSTLDVRELRFVPPQPAPSEPLTAAVLHPQREQFQPAERVPNIATTADSPDRKPAIVQSVVIQRVVEQIFGHRPENTNSSAVSSEAAVRGDNSPAASAAVRSTPDEPIAPAPTSVRHSPTAIVKPQIVPLTQPIKKTAVASPALPQPAPTIQVTIGRIEVRATAPANPPSTRTRQQPPVMSLEEYLRQRGGRK